MNLRSLAFVCAWVVFPCNVFAQGWPPWADSGFSGSPSSRFERPGRGIWDDPDEQVQRQRPPEVQHGGSRPDIAPITPPLVAFPFEFPANSIVIDTGARKLYYVLPERQAYVYPISVGREGFNWSGAETVSRKQAWPDWHPPAEMRERDRTLPGKMTGGVRNPLGAMALYLGNSLYRVHGTNNVKSIGRAQSSGCFRMLNAAVVHLASLTEVGTPVNVVPSLEGRLEISRGREVPAQAQTPPGARAPSFAIEGSFPDYRSLRDRTLSQPTMVNPQ